MTTKKWIFSGTYVSAGILGWALAFAGSQYVVRLLSIEGLEEIEIPSVETSEKTDPVKSSRPPSKNSYSSIINKRNIFDSSAAEKVPKPKVSDLGLSEPGHACHLYIFSGCFEEQ